MTSPYSFESQSNEPAIHAGAAEKERFLKRTYSTLFAGILMFCASVWAFSNIPAVTQLGVSLLQTNWWIMFALIIGSAIGVRMVARTWPINLIAFAAFTIFWGLLFAPLIVFAEANAPGVVNQAAVITAVIFAGLTGYVFYSGKDFSFLGGALWIGLFGLFAIAIAGALFGFSVGIWYSIGAALLFSGFILYDTSNVLHHCRPDEYVAAAIELFTDVIMLFKHVLIMLMNSRD